MIGVRGLHMVVSADFPKTLLRLWGGECARTRLCVSVRVDRAKSPQVGSSVPYASPRTGPSILLVWMRLNGCRRTVE